MLKKSGKYILIELFMQEEKENPDDLG